ncbi:MAG: type II secretion system protein [Smithella sp.]|jgi:prepilin-type N-terminal cleavage/methylation domain-containing protein
MFTKKNMEIKLSSHSENQNFLHIHNGRGIGSQKGFTLIEVIATLVIVGILAALAGFGIVEAVKGYMTVKQNSTGTQKAQLAMSRIDRELIEMTALSSAANSTSLPIQNVTQVDANLNLIGNRTVGFDSSTNTVRIALGSNTLASGDILIDNVKSFTFTYYQGSNALTTYPAGQDDLLSAVAVNMTLINPTNMTLSAVVYPRNNANTGGVTVVNAQTGATGVKGWGNCFVATAAYGDPGHPMVQILREFRDRHLMRFSGGRWFVKQYYKYGPAAADMIRNRPLAAWAARCLLAPVAAFAFCLMYAPLAIPFIFFVSLIFISAFSSVLRRKFQNRFSVFHSRGSILVGLIVTMVVMAVLAAAMLPMFSASYLNEVYADQGRRVYYLAESGYRYASSVYRWAQSDDAHKNAALTQVNGKTYVLLNNQGSFSIVVYPLWFSAGATTAGATSLVTTSPGSVPVEFTGTTTSGYLYIKNIGYYSYTGFTVSAGSPPTVTFSGIAASSPTTGALPAIAANTTNVYPSAKASGIAQSLSNGGSLTLSTTGGYAFLPLLNGNFTLSPAPTGNNNITSNTIFRYASRSGNTLNNVTTADPTVNKTWTSAITVPASDNVNVQPFIRVASTGTFGSTSRILTYNVPIGYVNGGALQKQQYYDNMTSGSNWVTASGSTLGTQTFNSGGAMQVTGMVDPAGGGLAGWLASLLGWTCGNQWNVIEWNWANTNINLAEAWVNAQGFTNYDIQVKVKNQSAYFFTGMNFRGRANNNDSDFYTYGVSFIKPIQTRYCVIACPSYGPTTEECTSIIPNFSGSNPLFSGNLETTSYPFIGNQYEYGLPAIVLWERTPSGNFTWLAYRTLTAADGIVTYNSSTYAYRLVDWSTLMVRVSEGYSLTFTAGNTGTPIHFGDAITDSTGVNKSARVVMTPILTAGSWTSGSPASGTLVLADIYPSDGSNNFASGDGLYVGGVQLATAGTYTATKKNYIRVYFTGTSAQGTADTDETDENRLSNPQGGANWPPDDLTGITTANDYVTLVNWTTNSGVTSMNMIEPNGATAANAIIVTTDLVSPAWTTSSTAANFVGPDGTSAADNIGLVTGYGSGTSTYYDDFGAQIYIKLGTGFLSPIQQ